MAQVPLVKGGILLWFHHWLSRRDERKRYALKEHYEEQRELRRLQLKTQANCKVCHGHGYIPYAENGRAGYRACKACNMTGKAITK